MPLRVRAGILGIGAVAISPLVFLLLHAPPDGHERAEFALFVGRFHPLAVHLPVALLLLVPFLECVGLIRKKRDFSQAAEFVLGLAVVAAVASAWLGWLLAWSGGYEGALVTRHMWGGVTVAAMSLICWGLCGWKRGTYGIALLFTLGLLIWTSDQGGKLTHGPTFLSEHAPESLRSLLGGSGQSKAESTAIDPTSFYATRVQPIFDQKCTLCHNAEKFKGKLRLDSYEHAMRGGKDGAIIKPGGPGQSELLRRVTLPSDDKNFMPAEGKPALSAEEIKIIDVWISAGATPQISEKAMQGLPATAEPSRVSAPVAPDYRPQLKAIAALETSLGVRLVPRSQNPTDGLILRTVSAPSRCTDATLAQLAPVANLVVDAELARTSVTDKGMQLLGAFSNLRFLDLSHTSVSSLGAKELMKLEQIESVNLTATKVTQEAAHALQNKPGMNHVYFFEAH